MAEKKQDMADEFDRVLIASVKRLRVEQGMSQAELAERMSNLGFKFHQATIYKIEDGQRKITAAEAMGLAWVFDVEVDEMYASESDETFTRHRIATVADRMGQAILALDEVALRTRGIQRVIEGLTSSSGDLPYQIGPDQRVPLSEYLEPFRAFQLHNELLWKLRTEVWSDEAFQQLMSHVSGIHELAPVDRGTDYMDWEWEGYADLDPIDRVISARGDDDGEHHRI